MDANVEVNKADDGGETPLYQASMNGHLEVVRVLLDAKAEVNKANNSGETPLYWALYGNYLHSPQIAALLRGAGAHEP